MVGGGRWSVGVGIERGVWCLQSVVWGLGATLQAQPAQLQARGRREGLPGAARCPCPPFSVQEASGWLSDHRGLRDRGQGGGGHRDSQARRWGQCAGPTLVRSSCSGVAGPGPSPRALLLGDRLLPPRLSSAFGAPMLVQPGLVWFCGDRGPSRRFSVALSHTTLRMHRASSSSLSPLP